MNPRLLVSIKDIMALSDVSERTAKRRRAQLKNKYGSITLRIYCVCHALDYKRALEYMVEKRYDPNLCTRIKRGEYRPFSYEILIWEEAYEWDGEVRKILFQQFIFFEPDGRTRTGAFKFITMPMEYLEFCRDFTIDLLDEFVLRVLPLEEKIELLQYYGQMNLKRSQQRQICFVVDLEVGEDRLRYLAHALRRKFRNSKKIWFCKTEALGASYRETLGFREIRGTGFSVAGVPGFDRKGKLDVWIGDGDD